MYASENDALLRDILKGKWGYDGVVISDWYGTYTDAVPAGGLDLEMPGPARFMDVEKMVTAVQNGELDEAIIDDKVARLLCLMHRVGAFAGGESSPIAINTAEDRALARRAAVESLVLLKNEGGVLPIDPNPKKKQKVVLIGENGTVVQIMGGGSAQVNPHYIVSPLEALRAQAGEQTEIEYHIGTPLHRMPPLLNMAWCTAVDGTTGGLTLEYFHNRELAGEPGYRAVVRKGQLSWFGTVNPFVDPTHFSMRLSGTLTVPTDGAYQLHVWSIGEARVWVDGQLAIEHSPEETQSEGAEGKTAVWLNLVGGQAVDFRLEYITADDHWRTVRLGLLPQLPADPVQEAVDAAAEADIAIVMAGLTYEWESEGADRPDMALVREQDELIRRVAAVNPNTIVVLNVGSPVAMPWVDEVPAVVQAWYGGQELGNAIADILFGAENPSGKLPLTFPKRLADNPAHINYPGENGKVRYGEGVFVGYRYYQKKEIAPLFPFGHGLSYTTFAYDNLKLDRAKYRAGDEITATLELTNSGQRAGLAVVQLYVRDVAAQVQRPWQELKGFAKIHLEAGETKAVSMTLTEQSLAFYDEVVGDWRTESGVFEVRVGESAEGIRLVAGFEWVGESAVAAQEDRTQLSTVAT